jgi:hypothetical protein
MINYPAHVSNVLFPHLSPGGMRTAVLAFDPGVSGAVDPQVFAARLNMNVAPVITQIGSQAIADTTVRISVNCARGLLSTVLVSAADQEGDQLTYGAAFLADGMSFIAATHVLSWTPQAPVGTQFNVKLYVTTASGGTDAVIATLIVTSNSALSTGQTTLTGKNGLNGVEFAPNELGAGSAVLDIYDILGRRVAHIVSTNRWGVRWADRADSGLNAPSGIYFYRLSTGNVALHGRVLVVR